MSTKNNLERIFTFKEIKTLTGILKEKQKHIISVLYKNILVGFPRFEIKTAFFFNLAKDLKKQIPIIKQFYEKEKEQIYVQLLGVPKIDFELSKEICDSQKSDNNLPENQIKKMFDDQNNKAFTNNLKKYLQHNQIQQKRLEVMERFLKKKVVIDFENSGRKKI